MGQQKIHSHKSTITEFLHSQFRRQAKLMAVVIAVISVVVMAFSVKFSTDRYIRRICAEMHRSARILVETSQLDTYSPYFNEVAQKLEERLSVRNLEVVPSLPEGSFGFYSLGHCSIKWLADLQVAFYSPTHWAGKTIYIKGYITPRFLRSDLIVFICILALVLTLSYYIGTRSVLRDIESKISKPLGEIWEGISSGKAPEQLDIKELKDLWTSLVEYRELLLIRHRMLLAKEYYHEVKSPAYYQFNQLKRLTLQKDPKKQQEIILNSLGRADDMISKMEKALTKIANDDYARFPKKVSIRKLLGNRKNVEIIGDPFIYGDKTLFQSLVENLYKNALDACGNPNLIQTKVIEDQGKVTLSIFNPTKEEVDTDQIFMSGFTSKKDGSGIGLSLCKHIVEIHQGHIEANYIKEKQIFEIKIELSIAPRRKNASTEQNALSS